MADDGTDLEREIAEIKRRDEIREAQMRELYEWKKDLNGMIPDIRHSLRTLPTIETYVRSELAEIRREHAAREKRMLGRMDEVLTEVQNREVRLDGMAARRERDAVEREKRIVRNATLLNALLLTVVGAIVVAALAFSVGFG